MEISEKKVQKIYFKWLFQKFPNYTPMQAIIKFNEKFSGVNLQLSREISIIKSRFYKNIL